MLHKRYAALMLAAALPALSGCVQATRHSNTMVFGTNTNVGLKIGQNVNQVPEVIVGFDRQEAVIMPLLANTGEKGGTQGLLSPCPSITPKEPPEPPAELASADEFKHPCKFVGFRKGDGGLEIQDSYSVLASFGARIEGDAAKTKGTVGIAQYFATGAAAQTLAITGGAAVVSVGTAAEKAAENETAPAAAAKAVSGVDSIVAGYNDEKTIKEAEERLAAYPAFRANMLEAISSTTPANWQTEWGRFHGASDELSAIACSAPTNESPSSCKARFADEDANTFMSQFLKDVDVLGAAAMRWCHSVSSDKNTKCPQIKKGA